MKSLHQHFDEFHEAVYPWIRGDHLIALRRAFLAGYAAHAHHVIDLIGEAQSIDEIKAKIGALVLSQKSFQIDCGSDEST